MRRLLRFRYAWAVLIVVLLCACGSHSSESTKDGGDRYSFGEETGVGPDGGIPTGPGDATISSAREYDALPPPPLVQNADGDVLTSATIVAIFFANDDPALLPTLKEVYSGIGTSSMWAAAKEYGIGPATAVNVVLTEDAPATVDDTSDAAGDNTALENWLLAEISSNAIPAPTAGTIYMLNYPASTTVTANGTGCVDFDGYHTDLQNAAGTLISYGVVPRCTDMGSTTLITFSSTVSHETIESATDPYPDYAPGWAEVDTPHIFFDLANDGSEIADMCENDPEAYYAFPGYPFTVQRIWSNEAALAKHDPCVPEIPGAVFFNAVPELPDTGTFSYEGNMAEVDSVHIPVGGTATVYLDLYSDGAIDDWDVQVMDYNAFFGGGAALLTIPPTTLRGNNGSRLSIPVTVTTAGNANTNMQPNNTELFVVVSSQNGSAAAPQHYWYGIVTN
jgi:hypothetical protein